MSAPHHRRRSLTALAITLSACSGAETERVEVAGSGIEYGVLVSVGTDGVPRRVSALFGLDGDGLNIGELPALALRDDERQAVVVGFDRATALTIHPGFQPERAQEIAIRVEAPPSAVQISTPGDATTVEAALPNETVILPATTIDAEARQKLMSKLTVRLPVTVEYCRDRDNDSLTPLFAIPPPPTDGEQDPFFGGRRANEVMVVDAQRVVASTDLLLYVLGEDQTAAPPRRDPNVRNDTTPIPDNGQIKNAALSPDDGSGVREVILVGTTTTAGPRVWTVELDDRGFGPVRTATTPPLSIDSRLKAVAFDDDGHAIVVGTDGMVLIRQAGATRFEMAMGPPVDLSLDVVLTTGDAARPHLVVANSGRVETELWQGNAFTGRWDRVAKLTARSFKRLGRGPDGGLWAVGDDAEVWRTVNGVWTQVQLCLPPSLADCVASPDPTNVCQKPRDIDGVAVSDTHVYLLLEACSAMAQMRLSDGCISPLTRDGAPIKTASQHNRVVGLGAGRLVTVTDDVRFFGRAIP